MKANDTNPKVKKGDVILLRKASNSQTAWEGIPLEVTSMQGQGNFRVKDKTGGLSGTTTIYNTSPADVYVLYDRKEQAKFLRGVVSAKKKEISELQKEIDVLEKFDSDEEFVAYKIDKLMNTKGVKAKAQILKELKQSHLV